jgi:CubicO group peptidase (beta-lactamase class C family)
MRYRGTTLVLAGVLFGAVGAAAQSNPAPSAIDAVFARQNRTDGPGCALGVFRRDSVVFAKGYGMADLEQGIAINPGTVFYIASTSKQFAALSIALLAEQGRLGLDDPVRKHVPELPAWADSITVRNLVHHTSGIRDYLGLWSLSGRSSGDEIPAEAALDLIVRQRATDFGPGAEWSYSNSGYFLLSVIVERASGKSLRAFTDANVFRPLGMSRTHFHDDYRMIVPGRAHGYEPDGAGGFRLVKTSFALVGDGGLLTTVLDLARYDANFYHNVLGSRGQALIDQVTTAGSLADGEKLTYAFGLMTGTYRGQPTVHHGGSFIGFRAQLVRFPKEHLSVAVLCNDYTVDPDGLAYQVADLYLGDRLAARTDGDKGAGEAKVPPAVVDRVVGRYEVMPAMVAEFVRRGDGLAVKLGPFPEAPLRVSADTVFTAVGVPGTLTAVRLPDGGSGILASVFGMKKPAVKLPPVPVLSAAERAGMAGRYWSDELDTWAVVESQGEGLRVRVRFGPWTPLQPLTKDRFAAGGAAVTFERDKSGRITGYRLDAARSKNLRFERRERGAKG